ncbi:MAG TPA: DUF2207 domain-containing protein [Thermoprotei archaeon]|nr:DUF2207 domain-containing protein [Thermoprotei archaeon]
MIKMKYFDTKLRFLIAILVLSTILCYIPRSHSQSNKFCIEKEWCLLIIDKSGDVYLTYNLTVSVLSGAIKSYVTVGMPVKSFEVIEVRELETDTKINYESIIEGDYYAVKMLVSSPIYTGKSRTFILRVVLHDFIYEDKDNPGNVGLLFIPSWWDTNVFTEIKDLRVEIVLPEGVSSGEFKCTPPYDNILRVDDKIALYWERSNLAPDFKFKVGVSFPSKYVSHYVKAEEENIFSTIIELLICTIAPILALLIPFIAVAMFIYNARKFAYEEPKLMIEALGVRKGLTAVEAAYLIMKYEGRKDYSRILTMILFSLLKKGAVTVTSYKPLRLKVVKENAVGLRYYEYEFLRAIRPDGSLDSNILVDVFEALDRGVRAKMRGYCLRDAVNHYKSIVARAWRQVQEAGTPEIQLKELGENLEWLLIDPEFDNKLKTLPEIYVPFDYYYRLYWDWYWTHTPTSVTLRRGEGEATSVNIRELADGVASFFETATNQIATQVESVADKIASIFEKESIQASSKTTRSHRSVTCVCACVSCACVCACVSCACACASGGAG